MSAKNSVSQQIAHMELALQEAGKCIPTPSAFCVGAVIVSPPSTILATGYSRELEGNTHAEQNAIDKLIEEKGAEETRRLLQNADIYTTMEPCSVRLSGNKPCTDRILEFGIGRVFLGTKEPDDFVQCEGLEKLKSAGVEVLVVEGFADKCLQAARRGR